MNDADTTDTIFALASGGVPSGVAVVRLSGRHAFDAARELCDDLPEPGRFALRRFRDLDGATIDRGLVLTFAGPVSFTGEDVVELHGHGSPAVLDRLFEVLAAMPDLRMARAGEFTWRAFRNGRLDLTEVEGLSDLLSAETEAQRRLAVSQAGGTLRRLYEGWRETLVRARAMIEAELDFSDEDDVPDALFATIRGDLMSLAEAMRTHIAGARDGEIIREGLRVALLGPPNAGKSSLLNALAGRDAAIVTDTPGTTRDLVTVELMRHGQRVIVTDTAGLRESGDEVEREGMRRAMKAAAEADLRLWLSPSDDPAPIPDGLDAVLIASKADLVAAGPSSVSTVSAGGLEVLLAIIDAHLPDLPDDAGTATRARHRDGVASALAEVGAALSPALEIELRAEHLRRASDALGRLTGRTDVEDLLDVIFSSFCVGK